MKPVKTFPRSFRSSSAAYRAIRQFEEKQNLEPSASGLIMTKLEHKSYIVSLVPKMTKDEFLNKNVQNITYPDGVYRYFSDGLSGKGYYELKTGNRRRPNSKFITVETVYSDFINEICAF